MNQVDHFMSKLMSNLDGSKDAKIAALVKALEAISAMDPKGIRADDLGRAARIAAEALAVTNGT
jgi:hypothetical protein